MNYNNFPYDIKQYIIIFRKMFKISQKCLKYL